MVFDMEEYARDAVEMYTKLVQQPPWGASANMDKISPLVAEPATPDRPPLPTWARWCGHPSREDRLLGWSPWVGRLLAAEGCEVVILFAATNDKHHS